METVPVWPLGKRIWFCWHYHFLARLVKNPLCPISNIRIGEVVRPELRGFMLCTVNGSLLFGQFIGVLISRGTEEIQGKWSYESLIVLQYGFPAILLLFAPLFPESAYYQLKKGKVEKARKSLARMYGSGDQDLLEAELKRIGENIRVSEDIAAAAAVHGPLIKQCFSATNRVCPAKFF
jgi:hypothetical protein